MHASEYDLALYVGGELGFFSRRRVASHLKQCPDCRQSYGRFLRAQQELRAEAGQLPPGLDWERLAAEMTANIHLGLTAGEIVAPQLRPRHLTGWRPALVLASALLVVLLAWWVNQPPPSARQQARLTAVPEAPPVMAGSTASGIELKHHGRVLQLRHPNDTEVATSVSLQGVVRARYVDSESGQVTINNVYVQ
ncbi:MAG: zf-HC2 domain-containing protein [Bryobacteraceae bacterium]|nr:zf-HC2 domain-containing protein [Bryobacteraceae bacterium]MDW8377228.1 zf-HC2 domain-containing protein [Bryobacterales bacterium]